MSEGTSLLQNMEVVRWCYEPLTKTSLKDTANKLTLAPYFLEEVAWGNSVMGKVELKQWTTTLCQNLVKEALIKLGKKNVEIAKAKYGAIGKKKYSPDLETDDAIYEVKGRSWTTPGTAGEKILGVPLKYGEVPKVYGKPLKIVLVGYQEYEARRSFAFGDLLDEKNQTPDLKDSLAYFKVRNIEYIAFTDMLKAIDLPYGCWQK